MSTFTLPGSITTPSKRLADADEIVFDNTAAQIEGDPEKVQDALVWLAQNTGVEFPNRFFVDAFGALGDTVRLRDATVNGTSLSSPSYSFIAGDVGKKVAAMRTKTAGANKHAGVTYTTIASVTAGVATLTDAVDIAISGSADVVFGTDDTSAYQAACDAVSSTKAGAEIYFTDGRGYWIEGTGTITKPFHWNQGNGTATLYVHGLPTLQNTTANQEATPLLRTPGIANWNSVDRTPQRTASTQATTDVSTGDVSIAVTSTAGMRVGDFCFVKSSDVEYTSGALDYEVREYNRIKFINPSTSTITLQYPVESRNMALSAGAITVETYAQINGVNFTGGPIIGHGYDVDFPNGGGVNLFYLRHCHNVQGGGFRIEGVTGYPFFGHFNSEVHIRDLYVEGRPGDIEWEENRTGNYGCFAFHASRNTIIYESVAKEVRHLHDGFNGGTTGAVNCWAYHTRTSAFRTHLGINAEIYVNCRAIDCQIGFSPEAIVTHITNCAAPRTFGWGLVANASSYSQSPPRRVYMTNTDLICETTRTDEIDGAMLLRGKYDAVHIIGGEITVRGTSSNVISTQVDAISVLQDSADQYCRDLKIEGVDVRLEDTAATCRAIVLGGTAAQKQINGVVRNNRIWAPVANDIIEVATQNGALPASLSITGNWEMTRGTAIAATHMVTSKGGALDSNNEVIHSNYSRRLDAFPQEGTFLATLGDGSNEFTLSAAGGRYFLVERTVTYTLNLTWSDKGSVTGSMRVGDLPFAASATSGKRSGTCSYDDATTAATSTMNANDDRILLVDTDRDLVSASQMAAAGTVDISITVPCQSIYKEAA